MIMYTAMNSDGWDEDIEERKEKAMRIEAIKTAFSCLYELATPEMIKEASNKCGIDIDSFYEGIETKEKMQKLANNLSDKEKSTLKKILSK